MQLYPLALLMQSRYASSPFDWAWSWAYVSGLYTKYGWLLLSTIPSTPVHHRALLASPSVRRASGICRTWSPHAHLTTSFRKKSGGLQRARFCACTRPASALTTPIQ